MFLFPLAAQEQEAEETTDESEEFVEYYDNGNKKIEGQMKDEQRHGLWKEWYDEGEKKSEMEIKPEIAAIFDSYPSKFKRKLLILRADSLIT